MRAVARLLSRRPLRLSPDRDSSDHSHSNDCLPAHKRTESHASHAVHRLCAAVPTPDFPTVRFHQRSAAILSHELRNPLQAIATIGEALELQLIDTPLVDLAARIRTSTRRMSHMINDPLILARIRIAGGTGFEMQVTQNIRDALLAVGREMQDGNPHRRITMIIAVEGAMRCNVGRLQQVVSNLLANALVHGFPDSPVRFSARNDASYLAMEVWNDGEPIPGDCIEKIFLPFWRYQASGGRRGLGLGLHLCQQIVSAHGGILSVVSQRASGTLFTVRIPLGLASPPSALDAP
jgi:signal transduction histidine kinase